MNHEFLQKDIYKEAMAYILLQRLRCELSTRFAASPASFSFFNRSESWLDTVAILIGTPLDLGRCAAPSKKDEHFSRLGEFCAAVDGMLEKQEMKLRKLSIEYDEELYPQLVSTIADRRWLISHGLRLAALNTLESREVTDTFGSSLLKVPAVQVPGYNEHAYDDLVAAMEKMKMLELPQITQLERDQDYPIGLIMEGLTLARHCADDAEAQPDYFLKPDESQLQVPILLANAKS